MIMYFVREADIFLLYFERQRTMNSMKENNTQKAKLLIVDDDEGVLKQLKWALSDE